MPLPTLVKTWQYNVNNQILAQGSALADNRRILRLVKNALLGFGTNPWAMRYSCDSSTAGTAGDGVDRITADANLVWANAGTAHSWMVLRQTGIATNFEILISCESSSANGNLMTLVISPSAGFTGGSTTARPTATDEIVLVSAVAALSSGTDVSTRWSVMQSTDGQCTRIVLAFSGSAQFIWVLDKPANPTTGWSNPSVFAATSNLAVSGWISETASLLRARIASTTCNIAATVEGASSGNGPADTTYGNLANEVDSSWPMWPIGVASVTTGARGRHGTLQDIWFGSSNVPSGDTYPGDGSAQFAQFGSLILPWNGGAVTFS